MKTIRLNNMGYEDYKLPTVPNFIRRCSDDFPVPYGDLSDAQIHKIVSAWGTQLLHRAAQQRKKEQANEPR